MSYPEGRKPFHLLTKAGKQYRKRMRMLESSDSSDDGSASKTPPYESLDESEAATTSFNYEENDYDITSRPDSPEIPEEVDDRLDSDDSVEVNEENLSSDTSDFSENEFEESVDEASESSDDSIEETDNETEVNVEESTTIEPLKNFLRSWALKNNVTIKALSELSKGMKELHSPCFDSLPKDGRTIMKTPVSVDLKPMTPGYYIHFGLILQLISVLSNIAVESITHSLSYVGLLFNIDGLPLFNSSPGEFYPILFSIPTVTQLKDRVFPIGIYFGEKKPSELGAFLGSFITELNDLTTNGIEIKNTVIPVKVLGFCLDAPAKSYILGTTAHNGFNSCTRCEIRGKTVEKRRVFLEVNCPKRTHSDFLRRKDKVFQPRLTPLTEVCGLNFVNSFVIDYMHLICLGVMRTLIYIWCKGPRKYKLSKTLRTVITDRLLSVRNSLPAEFVRQPRDLAQFKFWKATEFRTFLLYLGPLLLKDVLDTDKYNNFLNLHVASTILLNPIFCLDENKRRYARKLLIHFVQSVKVLYGERFITHNFHNLIHIVDDADYFHTEIPNFSLQSISAFQFENYLQSLKRKVRSHAKPLQQVGKRLYEASQVDLNHTFSQQEDHVFPRFVAKHTDGPLLATTKNPQYKKVVCENFLIGTDSPNNCFQLKNGSIITVENIAFSTVTEEAQIIGRKFIRTENLYSKPLCPSSQFGILVVHRTGFRRAWPLSKVLKKCILLTVNQKTVVMPLLHCERTSF